MRYSEYDMMGLAILQKLEDFRKRIESGETQAGCPDWIIRVCEANVAELTQFKSRADWVKELK